MSPTPPAPPQTELERTELLGSLTTQQQQRTSARVIKKLKLEPLDKDKRGKRPDGSDDIAECDTPNKIDEKESLKFPTVKQRMPKALWSTDEKNLFFEALNEYGKDFDAITAYICAKMKKKGMADVNLKTKTQVSHFYYRTWHKLSKHVHFDENVKKVAQELYALINYGELRKKLVSVSEKACARLGELVAGGSIAVRARGRTVRVRTPMCRALRHLNQITERACFARTCSRAVVVLRARCAAGWARVQAAAHNPRAAVALPPRTPLHALLTALARRWDPLPVRKRKAEKLIESIVAEDGSLKEEESCPELRPSVDDDDRDDLEDHLGLEPDRMLVQELKLPKKPVLHVGPRPDAEIHIPTISPSEQLSSQKICFSSYLERMCSQRPDKDGDPKIRTPKRQRKDSATDPDAKKLKLEEDPIKSFSIEETAIDGIELMASFRNQHDDEEKPSTEDEKDLKFEETAEEETDLERDNIIDKDLERDKDALDRDKDMSEKEKDSFSEMEDDEKYNKSESDNESDTGKEKSKPRKFKNLKVKFRIRPKKRGGMFAVVVDKDTEDINMKEDLKEEDSKPDFDLDTAIRQVRKGWSVFDCGDLTIGDLYLMFGCRSKLELDYWWAEPTPPLPKKAPDSLIDKKPDKTPDKDSSVEDEKRESDTDIFSPKNPYSQDSNDGLSGDERKSEQLASPDHKSSSSGTFKLVNKLINRPLPVASPQNNGFALLSDRLKRLLALAGNAAAGGGAPRCACGHVCPRRPHAPKQGCCPTVGSPQPPPPREETSAVFRHPTPLPSKPDNESGPGASAPRRGRDRERGQRVVVQRLLPLLPKLPPPSNLIPVRIVPRSPPPRVRRPPAPDDLSFYYVLSESNGQFFFHDGDRRIPISPLPAGDKQAKASEEKNIKEEDTVSDENNEVTGEEAEPSKGAEGDAPELRTDGTNEAEGNPSDITPFLASESISLSPSRLLRDSGWLEGSVQDFSLSSFLQRLDARPHADLPVDSPLQSLMAESSVDYVAKFADLAAEVTDLPAGVNNLATGVNDLPTGVNDLPAEARDLPTEVDDLS